MSNVFFGASGAFHDFAENTFNDIHPQNYEAPKTANGSFLRRVLKPEDMDETNRISCLWNTRRNVIDDVFKWISDDSNKAKKVLWVYGLARTGKSTLSTTIAQIMRKRHRLGAFFFFNRDIPQRTSGTLIRTLAYQLAVFDNRFSEAISQVVANYDNIAGMPLAFQFDNLLSANALKSVKWPGRPIFLIIDALDECGSEEDRSILMQVLSKGFSNLPSFIRIMVVSRPESDIQRALGSHLHLHPYPLDIDYVSEMTTTTQVDYSCHGVSHSYVKGYTFDWDKTKSFVGTNDRNDRRIDFVMQQIMERFNHDHPVCSGRPRNELSRRRSVIPLNADTAFDDNLERLENKDIPIPRYLHEIAERLLSGPEVFVFDSW